MNLEEKVLAVLMKEAKSFGFSKNELKSAASNVASNLTISDDASEEEIAAAVKEAVDSVIPYLKLSQSAYGRMVKAYKDQHDTDEPSDDDDDDKDDKKKPKKDDKKDEVPEWAKTLVSGVEALKSEISTLKGEKVAESRRSKIEKLVKDTGTYGKTTLRNFDKMKFDSDEEFDEFVSGIESDIKEINQERANSGLEALGSVPAPGKKDPTKVEVATDAELDEIAGNSN